MSTFKQGDTFLGGGEIHSDDHLWIIINDPSKHSGTALFVNVTSFKGAFAEATCLLNAGDHPYIHKTSYVRFAGAKDCLAANLDQAENKNLIRRLPPVSAALLQRIRYAATVSPMFRPEYLDLL